MTFEVGEAREAVELRLLFDDEVTSEAFYRDNDRGDRFNPPFIELKVMAPLREFESER